MMEEMISKYICLILKCQNEETIKQYRPIRLCITAYKVVTKIIVNKIKLFLSKLIHPTQTSFIKGRRASDNTIIIHEVLDHYRKLKGKKQKIMIKIDLEKTYDKIEWSFVKFSLTSLKFPKDLIGLIMSCISTTSTSLLINGSSTDFFYLFIICMTMLSRSIHHEIDCCRWDPVNLNNNAPHYLTFSSWMTSSSSQLLTKRVAT